MPHTVLVIAAVAAVLAILPRSTSAHTFGQLYALPIPFWMYLYGAAAALVASFVVIGHFMGKGDSITVYRTLDLSRWRFFRILATDWLAHGALKTISVGLFTLAVISGFVGTQIPVLNFNVTFFWIWVILGMTYLTALIGNVWSIVNPWKILAGWFPYYGDEGDGDPEPLLPYPRWLGYSPALFLYALFIWVELFGNTTPFSLSLLLLGYTALTLAGAAVFGRDAWFRYGEFFSVFFRLVGRLAPVERRNDTLLLRPPFVGALREAADHPSLLLFVLFMLSSTAFDGLHSTSVWGELSRRFVQPIMGAGIFQVSFFQTLALFLSPFVFLALYLLFLALAKAVTRSSRSLYDLALRFAFSLLPIAFAYHIAHYYTLLLGEGQGIIRLISDPFGLGWNIFGTTGYRANLALIDAGTTWHVQVAGILLGHIAAVYLAHRVALHLFPSHRQALVSQFPMLALMVLYTTAGLWILALPITSG